MENTELAPPIENSAPNEEANSSSSSLTLSLTPPLVKDESSTISEHLSSIENDRSVQEIEVTNFPESFNVLLQTLPSDEERISQEAKPQSLNSSFNSSSIISLNGLEKFIGMNVDNAKSILEEILDNEQFNTESESKEESFNIFANVDLDDKLLNSYNDEKSTNFKIGSLKNDSFSNSFEEVCRRVKDFEELIAVKDNTIAALTSELDSFREMLSNSSTISLGTNTTEYKQLQEECHNKLVEYHNALVHKDEQIEKLTSSLQQTILNREEMKQQFKTEMLQLQEELEKTSNLLKEHKCFQKTEYTFDDLCSKFENCLNPNQVPLFNELKTLFCKRLDEQKEEMDSLKAKFDSLKLEQAKNLLSSDVLELKQELDARHSKEMEELRTYFEKKCADLEKNYSEEVFSQQSRKLSGSSSCSDSELSSDFVYNQPGPGGDSKIDYTKKDITKLRQTLFQMITLLDKFNLNEITDEDFENLKNEIIKFDLKNLLKYDLITLKNELQNKYHAELEILREDFDNKVDELNLEHENKLKSLEKKYLEEIEDLNTQLRGRIVTTAQQEVANSGEFEIDEVVQSYERRLQEQVTLAKIDIIGALENQIQRLVASESIDDDWPEELLQLKARFAEKYQQEINRLNEEHSQEISRLKDEHARSLNAAVERARRRSLRDADSLSKGEIELLKERDALKKQTLSLRNLLGEIIKYFTQCEDELNNTLVVELVTKNLTQLEKELEENDVKRVHITPNFDELINLIDNSTENDLDSIDLKSELGSCLQKLKSDANAILNLSTSFKKNDEVDGVKPRKNSLEDEVANLKRKLINETQIKNELLEELNETKSIIQTLETNRSGLENQLESLLEREKIFESELLQAKAKIAELIENGHREIVSEGYGENGEKAVRGLAEAAATLVALREKVRYLSENQGIDANIMLLIEDLARVGDKIVEEARKEKEDLKQQIEAADKKYKVTCQFLEDQAAEREQERDEAQKEITTLKEILKDREKDRASCERISSEVEHLEQQLREMSKLMETSEQRCKEVEGERKEAVDKIYELRDIIRDLEDQLRIKTTTEEELRNIVDDLEVIVKNQKVEESSPTRTQREVSDVEQLKKYVGNLEGEVQKLRLNSEIAGSEGALQQIKNHLCDFECTLDKRTKDLEGLHSTVSNTTCSSPSEDMSIRDVVQERTIFDECDVPLQQLARLKEKLLRHSRAEDAAIKRIRDLELQILSLKSDLEESQSERDILRKQVSDDLVLISNLQIRLDEQRIRAEHIEKQTNTSLELQNYDLKNTITSLEEKLSNRDKTITHLKDKLEEMKRRLEEISQPKEDEMIIEMQQQLEFLRSENMKLKTKLEKETQIYPNLFENIIAEKNSELEKLKEKLSESEKQFELFTSLNLDKKEMDSLIKLRLSGISFQDLDNFEQERRVKISNDSVAVSPVASLRTNDKTVFLEPEISSIEKIGPSNLFFSLQIPQNKANSTEKHVRFEDEIDNSRIFQLQKALTEKDQLIQDYENRLERLKDLQDKIEQLQVNLDQTENNLTKATETFQKEQKQNEEKIKDLKLELAAQRCELTQKDEELKNLQQLKSELKNSLKLKEDELRSHEEALKIQNDELKKLQDDLAALKNHSVAVTETIQNKDSDLNKLKKENEDAKKEIIHLQCLLNEKDKIIEQMEADSKSLHINLETIQNKLQETGNVVDLSKRLRDEQKKNSALLEELHELKAQLLGADKKSIEDIADQVQKELDYSAYLDATLINAFSDGSLENEDLESLKIYLKKQKAVNKQLVKSKELVDKKFEELERKYEILRRELEKVQLEDATLIGELRIKLDKALRTELEFDRVLKLEKNDKLELENRLKSMKHKLKASSLSLPEVHHDYNGLTRIISTLEAENIDLKKEIALIQASTRDNLTLGQEEIHRLERKLSEVKNNERILRNTVNHLKEELDDKNKELVESRKKIEELDKKKLQEPITEQLLAKIQELNEVVRNDRQLMSLVEKLKYENKVLEERLRNGNLPFDDPASRANYLFAKFLRSESYRKALAWQKRYLVSLLETYQTFPYIEENLEKKKSKSKSQNRFKCLAVMVVSIYRMKFLVRRWHSGKRITEQRRITQPVQFQVGEPVSSQNFTTNVKTMKSALNQPKTDMPWYGTSPPSKEPIRVFSSQMENEKIEASGFQKKQYKDKRFLPEPTLQSPAMLSQYIERFNQIQEKLGLNT